MREKGITYECLQKIFPTWRFLPIQISTKNKINPQPTLQAGILGFKETSRTGILL